MYGEEKCLSCLCERGETISFFKKQQLTTDDQEKASHHGGHLAQTDVNSAVLRDR